MKKNVFLIAMLVVLGVPAISSAVHVDVNISLPALVFPAPPPLVVIPGTYVYFAPDADADVLFYDGWWYRPYEGQWYRSQAYSGPWGYVASGAVPQVVINVPPDFRHRWHDRPRIAYGEFHRNWHTWERNKHWEHDRSWMEGRHPMEQKRMGPRPGERGPRLEQRHEDHRQMGEPRKVEPRREEHQKKVEPKRGEQKHEERHEHQEHER